MTEKELMLSGQLYNAGDVELFKERLQAKRLIRLFNSASDEQIDYRLDIIKKLFKKTGNNVYIEPPFRCDYGYNIVVGNNFYANYDCIILDVCDIIIGDNVFFAPRVCLFSASHPVDAAIRNSQLEYGKPITIGNNVWIGGGTIVNPGVKIGDNSIIGSGSVVTKNIPPNVIAAGNPCRILRKITNEDAAYWSEEMTKYRKIKNQ